MKAWGKWYFLAIYRGDLYHLAFVLNVPFFNAPSIANLTYLNVVFKLTV